MDKEKYLSGIIEQLKAERDEYLESCHLWESKCDSMMELPRDADGEPWRLGDELMMEGEVCDVVGIGDKTIFYAFGNGVDWTIAHNNRHHHAHTVEDVLREFAEKVIDSQIPSVHPTYEEAIAEYAAKLQLAESEDA